MPDLNGMTIEQYLWDSIHIEPLALQEEYVRVPSDLAYWNAQYSDAFERLQRAKLSLDLGLARLNAEHRELLGVGGKKTTEAMVDAAVALDPEFERLRLEVIVAESQTKKLYGFVDAVRSKKEMIISVGAQLRAEMGGDPSLRAEHASAHMRDLGVGR